MTLFLVRHGEIPSNVKKIYAGTSPERLTVRGELQAKAVAGKLTKHNIYALYSSPVKRALQTAEIIGKAIGKDVLIEDAFREMELGPWENVSEYDVARIYPVEWAVWQNRPAELKLPGREILDELLDRVLKGILNIYRNSTDTNVVIVTHVAVIRVFLLWHAMESLNLYKTIHVPNAEIFEIMIDAYPSGEISQNGTYKHNKLS